MHESVSVSKIA